MSDSAFSRSLRGDPGGRQNTGKTIGPGWLRFDSTRLLPFLPAPVVAIASKELRYAFRGTWAYSAVLYTWIIGSWSILASPPSLGTLYQTLAFFAGSIVLFTASGNFASLAFPVQRDISAMKSQPSQPALFMFLATVLCLGGALVFVGAVCLRTPYLGLSAGLTFFALVVCGKSSRE